MAPLKARTSVSCSSKALKNSGKKQSESKVDVEPSIGRADQVEETIEMMSNKKRKAKSDKTQGEIQVDVEPSTDRANEVEETIEMMSNKKRKAKGTVTMEHLQKRKFTGEKMAIQYNAKGQMYSQANTYMQSFIGNLVKRIPITYTKWVGDESTAKIVPKSTKAKIWEQVEGLFDLGRGGRKAVLTSAAEKFRNFKYRLTRDFIVPFKDDPQALAKPPARYSYITEEQLHEFVRIRLDDKWDEEHTIQSNRRAKNEYDHHLSRKGYAGLEQDLLKEMPGETEVNRAVLWMKARQYKNGNILNPKVEEKAKLIKEINKGVEEGGVICEGTNDVLTMALGTPEHNGRVRGVGGRVNPSIYFNFPKCKRDSVKEVVKQLGEVYEAKTQERLRRQNILWEARLKAFFACSISGDKAPSTPLSEKASHNEYEPPTDQNIEPKNDVLIEPLIEEINEAAPSKGKKCGLAIECAGQIVAHGHIVKYDASKVHGSMSLKADHLPVVIDDVLDEWARLPNPIPEKGVFIVGDAKDAIILWPKDLVILSSTVSVKQCVNDHQVTQLQKKDASLSKMSGSLTSLKMLGAFASTEMAPDYTSFQIEDKVFGYECKGFVMQSDIARVRNLDEVTASIIVTYIRFLYGVLEQSKMVDMVKFADPDKIGGVGCGPTTIRSRTIATALKGSSRGQLCLLPQNSGSHWTLTVINFDKEIVHFMEPLNHEMAKEEWISVVDNGIKMAKIDRKFSTKKVVWKCCEGVPLQPDGKQCGYFVMKYMKEIIADEELSFATKWEKLSDQEYTQEDIDEVREEWAKFVAPFYVK